MSRCHIPRLLLTLAAAALAGVIVANVSTFGVAATGQQIRSTPELLSQMQHHFSQLGLIHEALIRGDLPGAREPARQLAASELPQNVTVSMAPFLAAMRLGAKRAAEAQELTAVAAATTSMLITCGDCHRTAGTMPVPLTPKRPPVGGLVGHMLEHQRGVDEMLEGLFIPSESQWLRGATRFAAASLQPQSLPRDAKLTPEVRKAEEGAHQLALRAAAAETWKERGEIYVQMLATCASCHRLHGVVWGPRRSP